MAQQTAIEESLIQDDWYSVSECMECGSLYTRATPANAVRCRNCIHSGSSDRNFEAEQQANITLGREVAVELR